MVSRNKVILSTWELLEIKVYEALGVKQFRKIVLKLEKFIHHKDKKQNINYHIARLNFVEASEFIKFLFYNGAIHVRNIMVLLIYFVVFKIIFGKIFIWFDYLLILFGIKDIYCVILQRYNYLHINASSLRVKKRDRVE